MKMLCEWPQSGTPNTCKNFAFRSTPNGRWYCPKHFEDVQSLRGRAAQGGFMNTVLKVFALIVMIGCLSFSAFAQDKATQSLTLTVNASLAVTTTSLPSAVLGVAYSVQLAATGGVAPYTWAISAGSLPTGLTLSSTGLLSGTPTASGSFTFTVQVTDSATSQAIAKVLGKTTTLGSVANPKQP